MDEDLRSVEAGGLRASPRESVSVRAGDGQPLARSESAALTHRQPVPPSADGDEAAMGAGELAQVGVEFASPFDDEFDTPAFLRRRASEN